MGYFPLRPRFPSGEILFSPAVADIDIEIVKQMLRRHLAGYWGDDPCEEDSKANEQALARGEAILSQFRVACPNGVVKTVTIMTEADRSYTVFCIFGEPGFPQAAT